MAERARAAAQGRRRAARRLRALQAPPRGRRVARPARRARPAAADPVARVRAAPPPHRRLPLLLRAHARAEIPAIPALAREAEALGDALPRLRHPRQAARGARLGAARPTPGSSAPTTRSAGCPTPRSSRPGIDLRDYDAAPADRPRAPGRRPRPVEPPPQGHRARDRRLRAAPGRPRDRRGPPPRRGAPPLRGRRHRRRPAERRLVRPVRDRGDGARQARRHLPPRRGGRPHGGGLRDDGADRLRHRRDARRPRSARSSRTPPSGAASARRAAPTSSASTTSSRSPTACSTSTLGSEHGPRHAGQAARQAHGRLRPRRARLADPRRPPPPALHALPRPGAASGRSRRSSP